MKLLKLSLLAMILAFVMMSCKEDSTSPKDEAPVNYNLMVVTYEDGVEIDKKTVQVEGDVVTPDEFYYTSYHDKSDETFVLKLTEREGSFLTIFDVRIGAKLLNLEAGTYQFTDSNKTYNGTYYNTKIDEQTYAADTTTIEISKVEMAETNKSFGYYLHGKISFNLVGEDKKVTNKSVSIFIKKLPTEDSLPS